MSRMADLHIDIIIDLSAIPAEITQAIECGCSECELYTTHEIDKQFRLAHDIWAKANPLRLI